MPREAENLVGRKFGTRKVIGRGRTRDYGGYKVLYWKVKCACGHVTDVQGSSLKRGAGCQKCRGAGRASNHEAQRPPRPDTTHSPMRSRKQLTVRDAMRILAELPQSALLSVHLVGKEGHATRRVKDVTAIRGHVLLVAELPKKIEPWKG